MPTWRFPDSAMYDRERMLSLKRMTAPELETKLTQATMDHERLQILIALGWALAVSDVDRAEACVAEARALSLQLGQRAYEADMLLSEAHCLMYRGQYAQTLVLLDRIERLHAQTPELAEVGIVDLLRASTYFHMSDYPTAHEVAERALQDGEKTQNIRVITSSLALLGSVAVLRKNYDFAVTCYQKSISYYETRGYARGLGKAYNNLAQVYQEMNRFEDALATAETALHYYRAAHDKRGEMYTHNLRGKVYLKQGRYDEAAQHFRLMQAIADELQDTFYRAIAFHELAHVQQKQGYHASAVEGFECVLAMPSAESFTEVLADTHREMAACYEALGDYRQAFEHFRAFHEYRQKITDAELELKLRHSQYKLDAELTRQEAEVLRLRHEQTQRKLEHADRLTVVGKMASSIAHEINNPLQTIYGNLLLMESVFTELQQADLFAVVIEQIERIIRLVAGMREMYQVEVRDKAPLDISETVRKVLMLMHKAIQEQGVVTVLRLAEGLPRFVASSTHMQQVVFNVILNALNAMPDGGTLTLSTDYDAVNGALILEMTDDGVGISQDDLKRVFDPFYTTQTEGSGLGLSICQNIVKHYGGDITLTSTLGQGTQVRVYLYVGATNG